MNTRAVVRLLGLLCALVGVALLVPAGLSALYGESDVAVGFSWCALAAVAVGGALALAGRGSLAGVAGRPAFFRREGIAVVGIGWVLASVLGALPFLVCGVIDSPVDAFFEAASGFTTTGSTIFDGAEIDALPRGVNFWRCFSQWIGGIGIVLVFVTLLPAGGRSLFRSEGVDRQASESRVRDSAMRLLRVYALLTLAGGVALHVAGMSPFDAMAHAFTCISTGGFSTRGSSIAYYGSAPIETVCMAIMMCGGTSFTLWILLTQRAPARGIAWARRSSELAWFVALLFGLALVVTLILWFWGGSNGLAGRTEPDYRGFLTCLRDASFSVVSLQTTTGLATANFDAWPNACRVLLMAAIVAGACTCSTGGGVKIARLLLAVRSTFAAVRAYARPRAVARVSIDGEQADADLVGSALHLFALWCVVAFCSAVALTLLGSAPTEAITGVIACLNTAGPGLGGVGPASSFGALGDASKLLLSGLMILGRLELFSVVALFFPSFWRR